MAVNRWCESLEISNKILWLRVSHTSSKTVSHAKNEYRVVAAVAEYDTSNLDTVSVRHLNFSSSPCLGGWASHCAAYGALFCGRERIVPQDEPRPQANLETAIEAAVNAIVVLILLKIVIYAREDGFLCAHPAIKWTVLPILVGRRSDPPARPVKPACAGSVKVGAYRVAEW